MSDIRDTLNRIKEDDRERFLRARNLMRRVYLVTVQSTVGILNYNESDDTFMDAIDMKVEMLMERAGIETVNSENRIAQQANASDPFAIITRPVTTTKQISNGQDKQPDQELEKMISDTVKENTQSAQAKGWGNQ